MNILEALRNCTQRREASRLMNTFDQARGKEDIDSRNTRFSVALKLHYFHDIDAHEDGFSSAQEGSTNEYE